MQKLTETRQCAATDIVEGGRVGADRLVVKVAAFQELQPDNQRRCQRDQPGSHQQQAVGADITYQQSRQRGPPDGADAGTRTDKTEQAGGLLAGERVRHETPEHGDVKQAEQADPDVKGLVQQYLVRQGLCAQVEQYETGCEQAVDRGYQPAHADPGHRGAVQGHRQRAADKGEGPQPADLGVGPVARHGVAYRAQDVIGAHQDQHQHKGRQGGAHLVGFYVTGAGENALQ